jgi:hypothetical protein
VEYTLAQLTLLAVLLWLPFAVVRWLKLGSLTRGAASASIRLGFLLVAVFLAKVNWDRTSPVTRSKITGALVLVVLAVLTARGSGRGGMIGLRGRGAVDRVVGRGRGRGSRGAVVPRQGGGRVVGPRPYNAGGTSPTVVVVADRGVRAARGVARRVNRGSQRLEVVGGTAVRNLSEGRLPWRSRVGMTWINTGVWLETRLKQQRKRMVDERRQTVDELRGDFDRVPAPDVWRRRRGRWLEVARLRHDIDRRGKP